VVQFLGGNAQVLIGGQLVHPLREWKKRKAGSSTNTNEDKGKRM
jgi:hypothetical protein